MTMNPRRKFSLDEREAQRATLFAETIGVSLPELIRGWIEAYLEEGTEARPQRGATKIQVPIPPEFSETITLAEQRAAQEGITLRDVIRHEISLIPE